MSSPTQRTLKLLRSRGWQAQVVERWNPHSKTRLDLFGFGDVIACIAHATFPTEGIVEYGGIKLVQSTTLAHVGARVAKIIAEPKARVWLESGGRIEVHGWRKLKVKRGGKAARWECAERTVTLADFKPSAPPAVEQAREA